MNTNPTLLIGLALAAIKKSGAEIRPGDESQAELRVYPGNGAGWFFVLAHSPGRWYWKEEAEADHFNRANQADVDAAIAAGGRVQLTGYRGKSLALWKNWEEFEKAVN